MPNMHNLYSLGEVALKLKVSSAWINKIQKRTGIVQRTGNSGKISYFSKEEIKLLRHVKVLRILGFSLTEIKEMSEQEANIKYVNIINDRIAQLQKDLNDFTEDSL